MNYLYEGRDDFSFLASGNVIRHFSGMPCFPVRLGLELFERARHHLSAERIAVYDPCCGNGFSLTVLELVNRAELAMLCGSDIDPACVAAARVNLALTGRGGLEAAREAVMRDEHASPERRRQMDESVARLRSMVGEAPVPGGVFEHDILAGPPALEREAQYVFADIPYGSMTNWQTGGAGGRDAVSALIASLEPVMARRSVLAICGTKELRVHTELFDHAEKLRAGKRLIYLLTRG